MFYKQWGGNAAKASSSKEVINTFVKALFLIVGVYLIIALVIFGYKQIIKILTSGAESMYIVRANVEDVYSFNTNVTGYMKYMTLMENYVAKMGKSFEYLLYVFVNFIYFLFMFARIWIVGALIIIAPLSTLNYMRGLKAKPGSRITNLLYFENWLSFFIRIVMAPIAGVLIYRFLILTLA